MASAVILQIARPSSPRNLTAVAGVAFVNLSWSPPIDDGGSPVSAYRVHRIIGLYGSVIATVDSSVLEHNDSQVLEGYSYSYYVTAVNAAGEGNSSDVVTATVPRSPAGERSFQFVPFLLIILIAAGLLTRIAILIIAERETKRERKK